jgi:O-methyltransferase
VDSWPWNSFTGLPPPSLLQDAGDRHHTYEALRAGVDEVRENFRGYGLLDDQVRFLPGWFKDTLPAAPINSLAILRLDGDLYESTMDALTALYQKVSPRGFVIIDDYGGIPNCRQAVDDFRRAQAIQTPLVGIDWSGVFCRKVE